MLVAALLYLLRRLERWLHQHLFKVGWLVTKQLQTTTILYYAFFLPGIFVHEFVYWAAAGLLNVRADRVLEWPKPQEIGELKLNFVKLAPKTGALKLAVIAIAPTLVGLFLVWVIANNIINIQAATASLQGGFLTDFSLAIQQITSVPDFWLWFYLMFAVSNTFMPSHPEHLRGWRIVLGTIALVFVVLLFLGTADEVLVKTLISLNDSINNLSGILGVILGVDLFMVAVLGTIEAIIERVTGDSATFKDGKMLTMRRAEVLAMKAAEAKKNRAQRQQKSPRPALPAGPPSVYRLPLPIPSAPGKEPITRDENAVIAPEQKPLFSPLSPTPGRAAPNVISGTAVPEKPAEESKPTPSNPVPSKPEDTSI